MYQQRSFLTPCPLLALRAQVAQPGPGAPSCWGAFFRPLGAVAVLRDGCHWPLLWVGLPGRPQSQGPIHQCSNPLGGLRAVYQPTCTSLRGPRETLGCLPCLHTIVNWDTPWGPNSNPPLPPWEKWGWSPFLPVLSPSSQCSPALVLLPFPHLWGYSHETWVTGNRIYMRWIFSKYSPDDNMNFPY